MARSNWINVSHLASSEDSMETTVLTEKYSKCLGTSIYRIGHPTMETYLGQSLYLATFCLHSEITALTVRETENILLPAPEIATNLGYGIWLITAASSVFTLRGTARTKRTLRKDRNMQAALYA